MFGITSLFIGAVNLYAQSTVDSVVKITGSDEFGSAGISIYTPEIRENMEKLYEDKFGLFVHWGPYAQLKGVELVPVK